MNLRQLDYFVHVAELGSFSKAALVLDIAQPALSRQVRGLETELRENLLLRNGRGVALTDAGKRLFDHSVAILRLVAHAREDLGASRDEARGRVTVGLPPSIGRQLTLALVDRFRQQFPVARLAIVEGLSTHIVEWITSGRVDVGLAYNPEAQSGLEITPLLQEPLSMAQAERVAPVLKALADPVRLRLLSLVASHAGGEACVCDLAEAFDLSQPTISHHLKVLHDLGLLDRSKRGVWVYYQVRADALSDLGALIGTLPAGQAAAPTRDPVPV